MRFLITGICGFAGSQIAISLKEHFADAHIFGMDNFRRPGSETNRPKGRMPMQIPIELSPDQVAKAQQAAAQLGDDLNSLIQRWIDRLPPLTPAELPPCAQSRTHSDAARLASIHKVVSMTPEERRIHHAAVIARIGEEIRGARSASPQKVGEADQELTTFKQAMNSERRQRGAEPLYETQ